MNLDDQICYCYHVSLRKLVNFSRREQPQRASQLSNCLGAGTGCGWCIPILRKIFDWTARGPDGGTDLGAAGLPDSPDDYARGRQAYLKSDARNTF